jgi:hypothetical protein
MKPIWVKDATTEFEAQECAEWVTRISDINLADPEIFAYPNTRILRAYQEEGGKRTSCLYMPEQTVRVLESLAPRPGSEGLMEAGALKAVMSDVISRAERDGIRELMFQCIDPRVHKFIQKYGWYESKIPLFRYRIADGEQK